MSDTLDALRPASPAPDWQPGIVLERLERQLFRVQIEGSDRTLLCHRAGAVRLAPMKFRAGSRVWVVAFSPLSSLFRPMATEKRERRYISSSKVPASSRPVTA